MIATTYHAWRGEPKAGVYKDILGFCKSATIAEIRAHNHVLTPGRYVGAAEADEDEVPFEERFAALKTKLEDQFTEGHKIETIIETNLKGIGYGG